MVSATIARNYFGARITVSSLRLCCFGPMPTLVMPMDMFSQR
jgi:hypothetical protein